MKYSFTFPTPASSSSWIKSDYSDEPNDHFQPDIIFGHDKSQIKSFTIDMNGAAVITSFKASTGTINW